MWAIVFWIFLIAVSATLIIGGYWYYTTQLRGGEGSSGLFGGRPEKRLGIIEQSSVDGRRKLVLIRRDDVEHLLMTGGPVDVVIETNIGRADLHKANTRDTVDEDSSTPVFTRTPRSFGKAVGE